MWQCPACESEVEHHHGEILPRAHIVYRCLHCHLELVFDEDYSRFKLAPFGRSHVKKPRRVKPTKRQRPFRFFVAFRALGFMMSSVALQILPMFLGPGDRHFPRRSCRVQSLMEDSTDREINRIKKMRLDSVLTVVAEFDTLEGVRPLNVELEEQFSGLHEARRRHRTKQ